MVAARAKAKELKRIVDDGGDPLADIEDARAAPTIAALADRFEQEHVVRKRASTAADYKRWLRIHVRPFFGLHKKVADIQYEDIEALHRAVTRNAGPYAANRCIAVLSKMFSLAVKWRMRPDNPCRGVEKNPESKRRRYIKPDELVRLATALAAHSNKQAADIVRVLLLTGCRKGEALAMRWRDLDLAAGKWSKPAATTKTAIDHEVPLSAPVRQLLNEIAEEQISNHRHGLGEYVFPGSGDTGHVVDIKDSWRSICRAADIIGLRVHDLRHSFASQLASGGASLPLIGSLLGHTQPSTTARYAHLFDDPQRAAVERVGAIIAAAGKPASPEPVGSRKRGG
jgi:integrase